MDAYLEKFLQNYLHLKIQLEEIKSATDNFNKKNCIGVGGFGKVYKGEVSHSKGRSMVAIKRLDKSNGQGIPEFLKEITTLSRYTHENIISLVGFCYQGEEMILVYEHASRGSLDRYLNSPCMTWSQRIKICLDAAKGLSYLHDPGETHQRLIHCDIKSANILLDDQWNAKVADLGLSMMGSANEQLSVIVTLAAGTRGYIDPQYMMTNTLTKESDVYSFGVVLFEVLCGTFCYTHKDGHTKVLLPGWIESYKQKKLNDIIFKSPTIEPLDQGSLKVFSDIAYRCLNESREDRPMMTEVVTELETALGGQEFSERSLLFDYEDMIKSAEPPLNYESKFELWKLLFKGVVLNEGKTWFSLNKKGEHCEMISIAECLVSAPSEFESSDHSRFAIGTYRLSRRENYKVRVNTQFLLSGITYTVNLVFEKRTIYPDWINFRYKLEGETETSISYIGYESDEGYWWMCELYQFTSDRRDHEILFEFSSSHDLTVEGIGFLPLEEVEQIDEKQPVSDSDANWEEKLPADYEDIIKLSKDRLQWTTKKEAYSLFRKGFLINAGEEWISLDDKGKKCLMLSERAVFVRDYHMEAVFLSLPESRFGEAYRCGHGIPDVIFKIKPELVSSETTYATYLVYKIPKYVDIVSPVLVQGLRDNGRLIYLASPETPVIRPKAHQNTHNRLSRPKIKKQDLPRQRDDGWMEVQLVEFQTTTTHSSSTMRIGFHSFVPGLIIQGVEVRPI